MHIKPVSRPESASLRSTFELTLLFLDIVHSTMAALRKEPFDGGHNHDDDHDHDHGHTH
ncbi:MAG: hypothetical protein KF886_03135 [Candidatus Hydrogenedentes bacterium]|nr:hypothetical protein [Candidatus Hydrogenedentota bacterium]